MEEHPYEVALRNFDTAFLCLVNQVPEPRWVKLGKLEMYRYAEQTIEQAIVLKAVRYLSGLRACLLLLQSGYIQEVGSLQRVLQDVEEDITFLSLAIIRNEISDLHRRFLDAFWQEEYDYSMDHPRSIPRSQPPRKKIRAFTANLARDDPSGAIAAVRTISSMYSGYVHAAAAHAMDLYGGNPPRFHTSGMLGTPLIEAHSEDLWNQLYRGALMFSEASKALGLDELAADMYQFSIQFAAAFGKDYRPHT